MATKLLKPVKRELFSTDRRGVTLVVTLEPGDCISFRSKGKRTSHEIYLGHCYMLAQIMSADKRFKEAVDNYKKKKAAGYARLKKPRRPSVPFNKIYFDALNK